MYQINITNARVRDSGYGIEVNGESLDKIISTLLGTRIANKYGSVSGLPVFEYNCCDIEVTIKPRPTQIYIQDSNTMYHSVAEMEADKLEQLEKKNTETTAEE
jgi:hypothetical protein